MLVTVNVRWNAQAQQPHRAHGHRDRDRSQAEREQGRHEGAEHRQQHQQGDPDADGLRLAQVALGHLGEVPLGLRVPGHQHLERWALLPAGDLVQPADVRGGVVEVPGWLS